MRHQFRELYRLFFGRFLENDLICLDGDTTGTLTGILALLAAPGLFLPFFEFVQFGSAPLCFLDWRARDLVALPDKALHLGLAMAVLGIVTVLEWEAILPDRRDTAVLRPLPVSLFTLFTARLAALLKFWCIFIIVLGGLSSVLFPMAVLQKGSTFELLWYIKAHAVALLGGGAFLFLSMIAVQGILLNLLGWRLYRRWSPVAQSALVSLLLAMFFVGLGAAFLIRPTGHVQGLLLWLPPAWFVGLYQTQLGWNQPIFLELSALAQRALLVSASAAAIGYTLSYRKSVTRAFEESDGSSAHAPGFLRRPLVALLHRALLRTPSQRASFHFVATTLFRSRSHRVLVATWFGAGFALVFQSLAGFLASGRSSWLREPHPALLAVPPVLSLFLLYGLRSSFSIPSELRANWIFQTSGHASPDDLLTGASKATLLIGVFPLYAVVLPLSAALWGWRLAALHTVFGLTVAWMLMEALLLGLDKIPFTCSFVPGKLNLKATWPLFVLAYLFYVTSVVALEILILRHPPLLAALLLAAAAAKLALHRHTTHRDPDFTLLYDDRPEPAVRTLGLQE